MPRSSIYSWTIWKLQFSYLRSLYSDFQSYQKYLSVCSLFLAASAEFVFFFKKIYLYFMCISVLPVCMCIYVPYACSAYVYAYCIHGGHTFLCFCVLDVIMYASWSISLALSTLQINSLKIFSWCVSMCVCMYTICPISENNKVTAS